MIHLQRLWIILAATGSLIAMRGVSQSLLRPFIEARLWKGSGRLSEVIFCMLIIGLIAAMPALRRQIPVHRRGSWLVWLGVAFVAVNVIWLKPLPPEMSLLTAASLALGGIAVGFNEEIFMRGFAFAHRGEETPRFTVLVSSLMFGAAHFLGLTTGAPLAEVTVTVVFATIVGLISGILRLATGGLLWCALVHAAIDATVEFTHTESQGYQTAALCLSLIASVLAVVLLFVHPAMRRAPDDPG